MPLLKGEVPAAQAERFESADFGRFNLWRPTVVDRTRGSRWQSALPTVDRTRGSRWQSALPTVDRTRGSSLVQAMPAVSRRGRALPGKEEILCELPGWVPPRC